MASAYHADMTSAVNLGMVKSYSRSAINVIDETVPFIPSSMTIGPTRIGAFGSRKTTIIGHQWAFGVQQPSHLEELASCGFYALKELGKL